MNIALIGYGKMGKAIEAIAIDNGHEVICRISETDPLDQLLVEPVDIAIEFTEPASAFQNISFCLNNNIPIISGTTGWLEKLEEAKSLCHEKSGTFLYASNFSIGVNLFFELNEWLASKMANLQFDVSMKEIHHTEKKRQPKWDRHHPG